jgi:hypothetical protein
MADPGTNTDTGKPPNMTDAQWLASLHATGRNPDFKPPSLDPEANALHPVAPVRPAITPMGAAPEVAAQPGAAPGIPSMPSSPTIAKPTPAQSIAAGQAQHGGTFKQEGQRQFNEMRPEITAQPGTPEFFQQKAGQIEFDKAHPWGGDISAQPGKWGKIAHIAAGIGNVAGDLLAPGLTAMVPGSKLNENVREANALRSMGPAAETQAREAQTESVKAGDELVPWTNPQTGQTEQIERKQWAPIATQELKGGTATDVAGIKVGGVDRKTEEAREAALRQHQLMTDPQNPQGPPIPVPDSQLSPQELQQRDLLTATKNLHDAEAELDKAKNNPNSPQFQLAREKVQILQGELAEKYASLGVQREKIAAEGNKADKEAVKSFNHDYVTPAQSVEKSYQMMDNAYREYKDAAAKGQQLPTGAQSMVALSTHLSTTFGNVKGARITKDMIEHHLGARGVSDSAQVAIQRLTNGDVLSPAQWDAFHDLIGQSRNITWHQAVRAADRAQVPLDFLPDDLQSQIGEGAAYTPTQANPKPAPKPAAGGPQDEFGQFGGKAH